MNGQVARGKDMLHFRPGFPFFKVTLCTHKQEEGAGFPYATTSLCGTPGSQDRTGFQREPLGREGPVITPGPLALASGLPWGP